MRSGEASLSNPVFAASSWFEGALTGTIATTIAVLAIASFGFLLLSGRIDVRRSARVILGCFIIFSASTIAAGIHLAVAGGRSGPADEEVDPVAYYPPSSPSVPHSVPGGNDPYAGAAVPKR